MRAALAALSLWLLHAQAALGAEDASVSRDASLDLPLTELLALPLEAAGEDAVDLTLQQAVAHCRLRGISGVGRARSFSLLSSEGGDSSTNVDRGRDAEQLERDVDYCRRVRYVRHARQRQRELWRVLDEQTDTPTHAPTAKSVEVREAHDLEFQMFFETYAALQSPVVLQPPLTQAVGEPASAAGLKSEELGQFTRICFQSNKQVAQLLAENEGCAKLLGQFKVPLAAVNSYLPRTNATGAEGFHVRLVTIPEAASSAVATGQTTCPFGLHTLLVPLTNAVDYSLYDAQFLPYQLPADASPGFREVHVAADSASAATQVFGGLGSFADIITPTFSDVLSPHQTLFVPGGKYAVSLSGASRVLQFCYVDASNFNHVTEALRVDALVSSIARSILLDLLSPTFDTSMVRLVEQDDALWFNFLQWPKETKLLKRREMVSVDSAADQAVPMSRRERLKLWQEDRRWVWHIQSLTLPVPLPPVVMNTTRHSVTLRWQDLYERQKNDITAYGYEVTWKREPDPSQDPAEATEVEAGELSGAVNFTSKNLVRSTMPTTLFGDDFDGKDIEGVVSGLTADTLYSFSVRIYASDSMGVQSERTHSTRTNPCSVPDRVLGVVTTSNSSGSCAQFRWLRPVDNGGRAITSYAFAMQPLHTPLASLSSHDDPSRLSDRDRVVMIKDVTVAQQRRAGRETWLTASVCGQIPEQPVQIRVAAVNSIGLSAWSDLSAPIRPLRDAEFSRSNGIPTVRGRGDPEYYVSTTNLTASALMTEETQSLPRVIVSDVLEKLVVAERGASTESQLAVWAGHFSPRQFHVSSELVPADPLNAHAPLANAAQVRNRVVLVTRGDVPFLTKILHAQHAGALAVVLVDPSARCKRGFDQRCVAGSSRSDGRGFGSSDRHPRWREVTIPFVLVDMDGSRQLQQLLGVA